MKKFLMLFAVFAVFILPNYALGATKNYNVPLYSSTWDKFFLILKENLAVNGINFIKREGSVAYFDAQDRKFLNDITIIGTTPKDRDVGFYRVMFPPPEYDENFIESISINCEVDIDKDVWFAGSYSQKCWTTFFVTLYSIGLEEFEVKLLAYKIKESVKSKLNANTKDIDFKKTYSVYCPSRNGYVEVKLYISGYSKIYMNFYITAYQ